MPSWNNQPAVLFHGTDTTTLTGLQIALHSLVSGFKISLQKCRPNSDFGRGFYMTTNELQAREWANVRVRQSRSGRCPNPGNPACAVLLAFYVDRSALAGLDTLVFVRPTDDYFAFVDDCRHGFAPHQRNGTKKAYDVVFGPVRMWPQKLVIFDGDQVSFHTDEALAILPEPTVRDIGTASDGLI
jgi:hypothetical protein